ncbi:MAG TPA: glycosyltransferase family 4 protein [Acidimicrobiales bacterium]|nr:glycosyltransferase family 4 protein [Acidimicrobiales bacterium]
MPRPLRIAFLKPEFGVTGGLEAVVGQLEAIARADGHEVARLGVDMRPPRAAVAGLEIPRPVWDAAPEYFPYLAGRAEFDRLDVRRFDLVVSTQSPSFAVRHPRHLSVFYHHHRVYYDLEEVYLRAGFAPDETVHREAGKLVRELDQPCLEQVGWFLAGSGAVAERLVRFNGLTNASVFHAGLIVGDERPPATGPGTGAVLSVGRHEFPKRTELVVAAAHLLPEVEVALVGTGGREAWANALDHRLATSDDDPAALTDEETWCNTGQGAPAVPDGHRSNVEFAGRVSDAELAQRFADAPCVVAPAFQEDYGLTAIEAMAQGKPVIVCTDGGGLTELVEHERTGLVVEPTPAAIAAAIERLTSDRDLAAELGANGVRRAAELSWEAAADEWRAGMEQVLA